MPRKTAKNTSRDEYKRLCPHFNDRERSQYEQTRYCLDASCTCILEIPHKCKRMERYDIIHERMKMTEKDIKRFEEWKDFKKWLKKTDSYVSRKLQDYTEEYEYLKEQKK